MKKIILSLSVLAVLASCGGSSEKKTDEPATTGTDRSADPVYQKGMTLVGQKDCALCHKVDDVLTGPSYRDIAAKYAGSPDTVVTHLAGKIINGGNGVWGDAFMTPHPDLPQADAEAMVRYILLLKK